jgi:hypothetical protein
MSLQATVLLDIGDQSQTLTYTLDSVQLDQLVFANNQITFGATSGFELSKSDFEIYVSSLVAFVNVIIFNFPSVQNSRGLSLPLSTFELQLNSSGAEHIYYIQTSLGNSVYNTNYVPLAQAASFASRSTITITMQEFFVCSQMTILYGQQVGFN